MTEGTKAAAITLGTLATVAIVISTETSGKLRLMDQDGWKLKVVGVMLSLLWGR